MPTIPISSLSAYDPFTQLHI